MIPAEKCSKIRECGLLGFLSYLQHDHTFDDNIDWDKFLANYPGKMELHKSCSKIMRKVSQQTAVCHEEQLLDKLETLRKFVNEIVTQKMPESYVNYPFYELQSLLRKAEYSKPNKVLKDFGVVQVTIDLLLVTHKFIPNDPNYEKFRNQLLELLENLFKYKTDKRLGTQVTSCRPFVCMLLDILKHSEGNNNLQVMRFVSEMSHSSTQWFIHESGAVKQMTEAAMRIEPNNQAKKYLLYGLGNIIISGNNRAVLCLLEFLNVANSLKFLISLLINKTQKLSQAYCETRWSPTGQYSCEISANFILLILCGASTCFTGPVPEWILEQLRAVDICKLLQIQAEFREPIITGFAIRGLLALAQNSAVERKKMIELHVDNSMDDLLHLNFVNIPGSVEKAKELQEILRTEVNNSEN